MEQLEFYSEGIGKPAEAWLEKVDEGGILERVSGQ